MASYVTSGVEYALHCLLYLVDLPEADRAPSTRDLADLQRVPVEYLAKLFTRLRKAGLVVAAKGISGGVRLARPADAITVLDIVSAIDGKKPLFDCQEIRGHCALFQDGPPAWMTSGVCSIHAVMLEAEAAMRAALAQRSLADIAARVAAKAEPGFGADIAGWLAARSGSRRNKQRNLK